MSLVKFVPDAHSAADAQFEARETLKAVCDDDTKCVRMLVRIAMGDEPAEVAREIGRHENTDHGYFVYKSCRMSSGLHGTIHVRPA